MHNNFYFLRQLSAALHHRIKGYSLVSCFSQNKDELIIEFNNGEDSFFLKALAQGSFSCLSFPSEFNRASRNSVDLFPLAILRKVTSVTQFENERSLAIHLDNAHSLVLKMHSNRANILLTKADEVIEIFRNQFRADLDLKPSELNRPIDFGEKAFVESHDMLPKLYLTFGKEVWRYLIDNGFEEISIKEQWQLLNETLAYLAKPQYFISKQQDKIKFSLFKNEPTLKSFTDPIEAINEFFHLYVSNLGLDREKSVALRKLKTLVVACDNYLQKNCDKLKEIKHDTHYKLWADLLMANLGKVERGAAHISLPDFTGTEQIKIKLKPELNAQKNAEIFYRKSKNKEIEITKLQNSITQKREERESTLRLIRDVEAAASLKELRGIYKSKAVKSAHVPEEKLPYHKFDHHGFQIWVGKNAISNDQLTLKHSHKDDLWLHAKDVSGSHVIVKQRPGTKFPKEVIERAAELAAYNSKRKNESLCPVVFTLKKFVRKRKGDPAGMVVVEREEVIMVRPKL